MCGIAGIVNLSSQGAAPDRDALVRMAGMLHHRGPDEFGIYRDAHASLAHARLSIIDIATGQQPLPNEDETCWIVFNGEIFNYVELRAELTALGYRFRTKSDTEVIVNAYAAWGEQAFARMNGQWALGLWDSKRRKLVLSRDRFGVHPLYICAHAGRVYFASEIKAIFAADSSIPRAFDVRGIDQTFTFWSVVPPQSIFEGIEELRPAAVRTYSDGRMTEEPYWRPDYSITFGGGNGGTEDDAVAAVREALERATALRILRSDVPVGSYLSGGLDSSLIAALGRRSAGARFQTFSMRFEDAEYDETDFQRRMASAIGSEHHEVLIRQADIARVFPDVIYHTERPVLRTAPAPLFLLSQLVRQHGIKVVLTGEGADEMFAGYDVFREAKVRRFWARQPGSTRRPRLLERLYPYLARSPVSQQAMARQFFGRNLEGHEQPGFAQETRWRTTSALKRLLTPRMRRDGAPDEAIRELLQTLPQQFGDWASLSQDQYIEIRTLLSGYLLSSQGDRMLMAHSVEGRFPFLDNEVVDLANSLPPRYKLRVMNEKYVLKRACKGLVDDAIIARQKQPYRAPDAASFTADPSGYADEMLLGSGVVDAGVFDPKAVAQLWSKCKARSAQGPLSNADNMAVVGVLSTQLLHQQFIRQRPVPPVNLRLAVDADRLKSPVHAGAGR